MHSLNQVLNELVYAGGCRACRYQNLSQLALVSTLSSTSMSLQSSLPSEPGKGIGDGDSVIPVSSPIHDDLLWSIFDRNANMIQDEPRTITLFPELRALTTTRQSSQVCQRWRRILLYASSLWGNLLDLDTLSMGNGEWRHEILRSTGISLLSVRSNFWLQESTFQFFHGGGTRMH
jgi:hypothetical protein